MNKGLEGGLRDPSNFLTETLPLVSLFPRPLVTRPHTPSAPLTPAAGILCEPPRENPGLLTPSGSQKAPGQSQVNAGWQKWG